MGIRSNTTFSGRWVGAMALTTRAAEADFQPQGTHSKVWMPA